MRNIVCARGNPASWLHLKRLSLAALLVASNIACNGGEQQPRQVLAVYAASSLTDAFEELGRDFETLHPDVRVQITTAGSQVLRLQIEHGAPADVFASANAHHMMALIDAGQIAAEPKIFAHNELVLIVPPDNPAGIGSFRDLQRARRVVIGADSVPVGRYTRELLRRAANHFSPAFAQAVRDHVVSEESNVRLVRAKVQLAEADAAVVYRTDATACEAVHIVPIPAALNVRADYHIGQLERAPHPDLARRWLAHLGTQSGGAVLSKHGFGVP